MVATISRLNKQGARHIEKMALPNSKMIPITTLQKPKAIIFDLLTSLLDSWSLWDTCIPAGSNCDGKTWRARYLEITFKQGRYAQYDLLVHQSAKEVGLPSIAADNLLRNWKEVNPRSEVPEVLIRLTTMGVKLAVVTNCSNLLGNKAVASLC